MKQPIKPKTREDISSPRPQRTAKGITRFHGYAVGAVLLALTVLAAGDLLEIIPSSAPLIASPIFPFFHETHDLLALMVALYAAHILSPAVGLGAVTWFLLVHIPYAYRTFPRESPELVRLIVMAAATLFGVHIIAVRHRLEEQLNGLAANLESQRAAERRRADELNALRASVTGISAEFDLPRLFRAILERATVLLDATGGDLGLYEAASRELLIVANHNMGRDFTGTRIQLGEGAMGHVAETGEPLIIQDYKTWAGRSPRHEQWPWHGVMAAPLRAGDRLIGAIAIVDARPERQFTEADLRLLNLFAQQATFALERARLFETVARRAHEAETLRRAGAVVVATLRQGEAIELILLQLEHVVPYDSASVQLWVEDPACSNEGYFEIVGGRGWPDSAAVVGVRFPVPADNPNTVVMQQRKPYILGDASKAHAPFRNAPHSHIRSWLGVPLIVRDRVIGMLAVDSTRPNHFTFEHARLVTAFADQVAIAIENARLYAQAEQRAGELEAIANVGGLVTAGKDLQTTLDTLARKIAEATHFEGVEIGLYDAERNKETFLALFTIRPMKLLEIRKGTAAHLEEIPLLKELLRDKRHLIFHGPQNDPRFGPHQQALMREDGVQTVLIWPLLYGEALIGSLELFSTRPRSFSTEDVNLLSTLAGQTATAIQNARLFEAERQRVEALTALHQIGLDLSAQLDLSTLLHTIVERAVRLLQAMTGGLYLLLPDSQTLERVVNYRLPAGFLGIHLQLGEGLSGVVAQTGEPLVIGDYSTWPGRAAAFAGASARAMLGVPIKWQGRVLGVINVADVRPDRYSPADVDIVSLFADQAAVAIVNARLFQAERLRRETSAALLNISQVAGSSLELMQVLKHIAHRTAEVCQANRCTIFLLDEAGEHLRPVMSQFADGHTDLEQWQTFKGFTADRVDTVPLFRYAIRERRPTLLDDAARIDEVPLKWTQPFGIQKLLGIPLISHNRAIGLMALDHTEARRDFSPEQIDLALTIAGQVAASIENAQLYAQEQRRLGELRLLHQAGQALNADLSLEAVLTAVADHLITAMGVETCTISSWDSEHDELVTLFDRDPEPAAQVAVASRFPLSNYPHYTTLLRKGQSLAFRRDSLAAYDTIGRWLDNYRWRSLLAVPLVNKGQAIGLVELGERCSERDFSVDEIRLAESLASQAAAAIENARLYAELQLLATTDSLTGLSNRRHLFELAGREFERTQRYGHPLSAIMLDIDHFKRVNDAYGHAIGDQVLRAVAARFKENLRDIDLVGRYGGEEFAVLLPENDLDGACIAAERLRQCVARLPIDTNRGLLSVTISLGVAALTEDCPDWAALLDRADTAMYAAKKAGRNRVERAAIETSYG